MIRLLLGIVSIPLLFIGSEGLYHSARNPQQTVMTCEQFARERPAAAWIRLTNCDVDYIGAGYRDSGGRITELLFPVRPAGQPRNVPATAIVATTDANALSIAERTMGGPQPPDQEAFLVMMLTIVTTLKAAREVEGYVRVGFVERQNARRIVSGLSGPIDPAFVVIDLHQPPPMLVPALEAAAGALALLLFVFLQLQRRRRHSEAPTAVADAAVSAEPPLTERTPLAEAVIPVEPSRTAPPRRLRGLMLLNLPADAGMELIENAPPLGNRAEVLQKLEAALPGIRAYDHERCALNQPDYAMAISIGSTEPIATAVVEAEGEGAAAAVRSILHATGWRAFSPRRGAFIDPGHLDEAMETRK